MALSVPTGKQDFGDKKEFRDSPSPAPDNAKDLPFASIAPDHLPLAHGRDSYSGIPGDGIVEG